MNKAIGSKLRNVQGEGRKWTEVIPEITQVIYRRKKILKRIRQQLGVADTLMTIENKWPWAGHTGRRTNGRSTRNVTDWIILDAKRPS